MEKIVKNDIVFHTTSKLYFICENTKQEKWMNMNPCYSRVDKATFDLSYFAKTF